MTIINKVFTLDKMTTTLLLTHSIKNNKTHNIMACETIIFLTATV